MKRKGFTGTSFALLVVIVAVVVYAGKKIAPPPPAPDPAPAAKVAGTPGIDPTSPQARAERVKRLRESIAKTRQMLAAQNVKENGPKVAKPRPRLVKKFDPNAIDTNSQYFESGTDGQQGITQMQARVAKANALAAKQPATTPDPVVGAPTSAGSSAASIH